ncbi:uncharacterized protein LOC124444888 isoform X2 [Xenia sp. Carnegie-2017]|uniref:uncharacterized protein LOC124444888 isoform X2 n=1 Tax=Xenia sp. Carnegie-2017 TaxID=2897299 RepID=UPI001F04924D|nr:uncharacterized protein LOC124444888 isoform X2 [Xenia sp. Carnegie-2017]
MDSLMISCVKVLKNGYQWMVKDTNSDERKEKKEQNLVDQLLKRWSLASSLNKAYKNVDRWTIHVQDLMHPTEKVVLHLYVKSLEEFKRFQTLLRSLVSNHSKDFHTQILNNNIFNILVTKPGPVLISIVSQGSQDSSLDCSQSESSSLVLVLKTLKQLLNDLSLSTQNYETNYNKTDKVEMIHDVPHDPHNSLDVLLQHHIDDFKAACNEENFSSYKNDERKFDMFTNTDHSSSEVERLREENERAIKIIQSLNEEIRDTRHVLQSQVNELARKNNELREEISRRELELQETFTELGRMSFEMSKIRNESRRHKIFQNTYTSQVVSTQTDAVVSGEFLNVNEAVENERMLRSDVGNIEIDGHGNQETLTSTPSSLTDDLHIGVHQNIENNFHLLLLRISNKLLKPEITALRNWVGTEFEISSSLSVIEIFQELVRKRIINIFDLSRLKTFFDTLLRYDIIFLIDKYLLGDYSQLRIRKPIAELGSFHPGSTSQSRPSSFGVSSWRHHSTSRGKRHRDSGFNTTAGNEMSRTMSGFATSNVRESRESTSRHTYHQGNTDHPSPLPRDPMVGKVQSRNISTTLPRDTIVVDGGRSDDVSIIQSTGHSDQQNISHNNGSNGQKLSKPIRPDDSDRRSLESFFDELVSSGSQWLCTHYKRHCFVQFECCDQFWPCHRCHNNQSSCGKKKKLKSRDAKRVKCARCGLEQPFQQFCSRCKIKFAEYFCSICKHLTGTDDNPYHCDKCGICRVHKDRSFHCDVCGVCLDIQLRGNHKCREGSAHDECCICLEDAFTGCQILPCSHKVHKECAVQMIRSGM